MVSEGLGRLSRHRPWRVYFSPGLWSFIKDNFRLFLNRRCVFVYVKVAGLQSVVTHDLVTNMMVKMSSSLC